MERLIIDFLFKEIPSAQYKWPWIITIAEIKVVVGEIFHAFVTYEKDFILHFAILDIATLAGSTGKGTGW